MALETKHDGPLAVAARGFSFSYPEQAAGIGPLDWQVKQGAFQLLVGATGSGKTTLLRCLKPAIAPVGSRAGELLVFDCPVDSIEASVAAAEIGYVAQSPETQMVCDTVWHEIAFGLENLGVAQDEMRRRVAEVAHFFGIEPWFRRTLDTLSGGQLQLVNLASVLALRPRLLVLDEPTAQLDPVAEKNFLHALFRVNRELGLTIILATHAPEALQSYATSQVRLVGGHLVEEGVFAENVVAPTPQPAAVPADAAATTPAESTPAPTTTKTPAPLMVHDAYVRYARDAHWVLRGFDVEVQAAEIHALVGGNGCGKSTLLQLIAGTLKPERGRVINKLASRQALLPQNPKALFVCDTVEEELCEWQSGCGYDNQAIAALLQQFGLENHTTHHPYDLSGGQQQLLALAKLLLTDPDLLLLDEPTKGLDAARKSLVAQMLVTCAQRGVAVVMATHDLSFASLVAHRVTMLFDGEAACTQSTGEFFSDNLFYRPLNDEFARIWKSKGASL